MRIEGKKKERKKERNAEQEVSQIFKKRSIKKTGARAKEIAKNYQIEGSKKERKRNRTNLIEGEQIEE